jgi:hypothetical protein
LILQDGIGAGGISKSYFLSGIIFFLNLMGGELKGGTYPILARVRSLLLGTEESCPVFLLFRIPGALLGIYGVLKDKLSGFPLKTYLSSGRIFSLDSQILN